MPRTKTPKPVKLDRSAKTELERCAAVASAPMTREELLHIASAHGATDALRSVCELRYESMNDADTIADLHEKIEARDVHAEQLQARVINAEASAACDYDSFYRHLFYRRLQRNTAWFVAAGFALAFVVAVI